MFTGMHLIAGDWVSGETQFTSQPAHGEARSFAAGTRGNADAAVKAAEEAFGIYGWSERTARARFLQCIAAQIDSRGDEITEIGTQETALPTDRLVGERGRTVGQLRLFASHIEGGTYLDRCFEPALPDRKPLPRPDLRLIQRPVGPVAVFGASNFPLAFSVAGGDTASALAAGCPVVVKGHSAHPGTSEIVAQAIHAAIQEEGLHPGVFSLIQGGNRDVGAALVQHPLIRAVGFTGSLRGGRFLFDLCAGRPEPIPFFGELGSVNPVFLLPAALAARADEIARSWVGSLTMGAGQFCTSPGVVFVLESPEADAFQQSAINALGGINSQTMLTNGIAAAYRSGTERLLGIDGMSALAGTGGSAREAEPWLFATTGESWLADETIGEEVFGPLGVIVRVRNSAQMHDIARSLRGQLTCTLHMEDGDRDEARALIPILERKAGRLLANGFPTGVEVCNAMVHGGPYPASTNFGASSVGTMAIRRWLRPVCYQNVPESVLPADLLSAGK